MFNLIYGRRTDKQTDKDTRRTNRQRTHKQIDKENRQTNVRINDEHTNEGQSTKPWIELGKTKKRTADFIRLIYEREYKSRI